MTMKEFLKTEPNINLSEVAKRMWPNNRAAHTYMSTKLAGGRPWTEKDTESAKKALDSIYKGFSSRYKDLK